MVQIRFRHMESNRFFNTRWSQHTCRGLPNHRVVAIQRSLARIFFGSWDPDQNLSLQHKKDSNDYPKKYVWNIVIATITKYTLEPFPMSWDQFEFNHMFSFMNRSAAASTPAVVCHSRPPGNTKFANGYRVPGSKAVTLRQQNLPIYFILLLTKKSWKSFTATSASRSGCSNWSTSPPPWKQERLNRRGARRCDRPDV